MRAGFDQVITKPFAAEELHEAIVKHVKARLSAERLATLQQAHESVAESASVTDA